MIAQRKLFPTLLVRPDIALIVKSIIKSVLFLTYFSNRLDG